MIFHGYVSSPEGNRKYIFSSKIVGLLPMVSCELIGRPHTGFRGCHNGSQFPIPSCPSCCFTSSWGFQLFGCGGFFAYPWLRWDRQMLWCRWISPKQLNGSKWLLIGIRNCIMVSWHIPIMSREPQLLLFQIHWFSFWPFSIFSCQE